MTGESWREVMVHAGRVGELGRVERLLEESDPVLEELLAEGVVRRREGEVVPLLARRGRAVLEVGRGG